MANVLNTDKQNMIIGALAEGSSIRSIERMTGVHRDTIRRLGVRIGQGCTALMDEKMRNLSCNRLEMDEIWGFVGKKEKHVRPDEDGVGSVWTYCAIHAAVGLHFAYYNFVKRHSTIHCTPAMAAGVTNTFWSVGELVEAVA